MKNSFSLPRGAFLLAVCLACSGCFFGGWNFGPSFAQRAAQLRTEGRFDEAVQAYREHMAQRRSDKHRPPEENPDFYELLIGDVYLDAGKPVDAQESYQRALDAGVHPDLVNFKFRHLAQWYESKDRLQEAVDLLSKYRERDPLMFDYDIDRLHKKMVAEEDAGEAVK